MAESKKRPHDGDGQPKVKANKKRKSVAQRQEDDMMDVEAGVNTAIAFMDPQLLSDFIAQKVNRFGADLSSVELADLALPAASFLDTTTWSTPRTVDQLPGFLERFTEKPKALKAVPKETGSPHTLIVAGAGLRAADLVRAVRKFQVGKALVTKLFAKHFKIQEQVDTLGKTHTGIGVGTPQRLMDLIDNGALKLDNLERIVVDASHIDQKKRGILDMRDTILPLARFLTRTEFKSRYSEKTQPLTLLFY